MKPFNLEAALRGEPVVTRDGREVTQITLFEIDGDYPLVGVIDEKCFGFSINGKYFVDQDSEHDLFMAPKKRVVWVNLYKNGYSYYYDTEADADDGAGRRGRIGNKAFPIEIEE